ncbi:Hypothetical protein A7982_03219 [Minicystis rosea]|nr:Hypothetical protein A7982_03219 [Minicystis rosea]
MGSADSVRLTSRAESSRSLGTAQAGDEGLDRRAHRFR